MSESCSGSGIFGPARRRKDSPSRIPASSSDPARSRYRAIEEIVPRNWQGNTILANGIRQHFYRTGGAKPPVVLLHGFQTSGLYWLRLAQVLQADHGLILLDGRGHGRSDGPETGYSLEILAADTAALIDALDLKRPALLGHTNGASVAIRLASDFPQIPRCLILEDPVKRTARSPCSLCQRVSHSSQSRSERAAVTRQEGRAGDFRARRPTTGIIGER